MEIDVTDNYEKPAYKLEALVDKWPSGLVSAKEACQDLHISEKRLEDLADAGFAPHFRIDNGKPLFRKTELKEWAAKNLIQRHDAREFKTPFIQVVVENSDYHQVGNAPKSLRRLNILNITGEFRRSGIYFLCSDGEVVYVGQSKCVHSRISHHMSNGMGERVDAIYFLPWPNDDLDRVEGALIRALKPARNGRSGSINKTLIAPNGTPEQDKKILTHINFLKEETKDNEMYHGA